MIVLKTVDAHVGGQPLRLVTEGFPAIRGNTMGEKRGWASRHADRLRTTFTARIVSRTVVGNYPAIVPRVEGCAWITGDHTFVLDPTDPLQDGGESA